LPNRTNTSGAVGKIKGAEMVTSTKLSLHPMLWIAVLAVVLFCAAATAAITGWPPASIDRTKDDIEHPNPDQNVTAPDASSAAHAPDREPPPLAHQISASAVGPHAPIEACLNQTIG
jgi:hypothetical protein